MSQLTIYAEADSDNALLRTDDLSQIENELGKAGIRIERWKADRELADDADNDTIIAAYHDEIGRATRSCTEPAKTRCAFSSAATDCS